MKTVFQFLEILKEEENGNLASWSAELVCDLRSCLIKFIREVNHGIKMRAHFENDFDAALLTSDEGIEKMRLQGREIAAYVMNDRRLELLFLTARLRPMVISTLERHIFEYNKFVLALVMLQIYRVTPGVADLIRAERMYPLYNLIDTKLESYLPRICYLAVDNDEFCGWILQNWDICQYQKYKLKSLLFKKSEGNALTLYRLVNPGIFGWRL